MRITIHGPNLADQSRGSFEVHTADCRDNARVRYIGGFARPGQDGWTIDVDTRVEASDEVYPPEDFECESGENVDDLHFAPCCSALPLR